MDWSERIDSVVAGYRDAMILTHACKAGLFEALAGGPATAAQVAAARGLDERATGVVLAALAAAGFVSKTGDAFALEPGARPYLLADGEQTQTSIIGHNLSLMRTWIRLDDVLRSGEPVPRGERTPEEMRDFICGMENISRRSSREVAAAVDLGGARRLLDLGGGPATASIVFCLTHPDLECVVFDLPGPAAIGGEQIAAAGLDERIAVKPGDFLTDPLAGAGDPGFDVVYISNIVHMLGPEQTALILAKSHRVLNPGGRIMVKDFFLEEDGISPAWVAQFSVNMLVGTPRGRSYRRSEMLALMADAGFAEVETVDIGVRSQVLVANRES